MLSLRFVNGLIKTLFVRFLFVRLIQHADADDDDDDDVMVARLPGDASARACLSVY